MSAFPGAVEDDTKGNKGGEWKEEEAKEEEMPQVENGVPSKGRTGIKGFGDKRHWDLNSF